MAHERPRFIHCGNCNKRVKVGPVGRIPVFCGNACRQQSFVKNARSPLTADDWRRLTADNWQRQRLMVWQVLKDAGLIPADRPLPPDKSGDAT